VAPAEQRSQRVELCASDADRLIGVVRIGVIANVEKVGDVAQGQEAGADAQRGFWSDRYLHGGPR
jgi:hypothetical protein